MTEKQLIDLKSYPVDVALNTLLMDKTTGKNIIFATDIYKDYQIEKKAYVDEKTLETINLQPRVEKTVEEKAHRTRTKAEVFTPSWIVNQMNNSCDEEWFKCKDVFNTENEDHTWTTASNSVSIPDGKDWQDYVLLKRLEITCGEAPFVVSRYDTASGEEIHISNRIGFLDRKLRVVTENTTDEKEWIQWATEALKSSYGYEFQGDNLIIARINVLNTMCECRDALFGGKTDKKLIRNWAEIIAWNFWQMDGFNGCYPFGKVVESQQLDLFGDAVDEEDAQCRIKDWSSSRVFTYNSMKEGSNMKFDYIVGNPPYQVDTNGAGRQAKPVYNLLFDEAESMNPKYISFITPSRWFAGGMGLNKFRDKMMNCHHLVKIIDFTNSKDCFPSTSISGGVSYFGWKKDYVGNCEFTNITNGNVTTLKRPLDEFPIIVRFNEAVEIIRKLDLKDNEGLGSITSGLMPFGLSTNYRGREKPSKKIT